jgi:hypothetical protein
MAIRQPGSNILVQAGRLLVPKRIALHEPAMRRVQMTNSWSAQCERDEANDRPFQLHVELTLPAARAV